MKGTIEKIFSMALKSAGRAPIRIYMDGCFDMMHYGHANALRQVSIHLEQPCIITSFKNLNKEAENDLQLVKICKKNLQEIKTCSFVWKSRSGSFDSSFEHDTLVKGDSCRSISNVMRLN